LEDSSLKQQNLTKVKQWIVESGFNGSLVSGSNNEFVVEFSENEKLPDFQIVHENVETPYVIIVSLIKIPESDREKLKNLDMKKFCQLIWDIKLSLLQLDVDFSVRGMEKDPDAWEVQKRLFLNETKTNQFHETYSKVKNALISIIWAYKRALDISA
jgi:hypothetical protein